MKRKERELSDLSENLLSYLAVSEYIEPKWVTETMDKKYSFENRVSLTDLDSALVLGASSVDTEPVLNPIQFDSTSVLARAVPDLDFCYLNTLNKNNPTPEFSKAPMVFAIERFRQLQRGEARNLGLQVKSSWCYAFTSATIYADGHYTSFRETHELRGDRVYCIGAPSALYSAGVGQSTKLHEEPVDDQSKLGWILSLGLTQQYNWHVDVSVNPLLPSISFSTTPVGTKELFQSRDSVRMSGRRDALMHWVKTHYRKSSAPSSSDEELIKIMGYLRGATTFKWAGYDCKIRVSDHDLRRLELLDYERETLRALRKAKRKKRDKVQTLRRRFSKRKRR